MAGNGAGRETWKSGEFLSGMWPLLRIGKFLGMFHLRRISSMEVSYTPGTPFTILSVGIWSTIASIFVMALVIMYRSLDSPKSLAEQCLDLVFHLHVLLTHSYCMFQSQYFPSVFKKWAILEEKLNWIESLRHFECWKERKGPNCRPLKLENQNSASFPLELLKKKLRLPSKLLKQSNYVLTCWVITGVYISLTLIRVLAYFTSVWLREEPPTIWKYLHILSEIYVLKEISNSWTGIYILLAGFLMEICWSYGDMMILLVSYSLSRQYKRFNRVLKIIKESHSSAIELEILRKLHSDMALGVQEMNKRIGLLIATTFSFNIIYLLSRIHTRSFEDFLTTKILLKVEVASEFGFLLARIFVSCLIGCSVSEEGNRTMNILMEFPEERQSEDHFLIMERFYNQVKSGKIALTGSGYFTLNKGLIFSVVSVIATYEVMILPFSVSTRKT